jgi:hypothetical protein
MDDTDRLIESLKVQIKKEIVDNYFNDRVYLEEDTEILLQEAESYRQERELWGRRFMALYQALGSEAGCQLFMEVLKLEDWPHYQQYCALPEAQRQDLLKSCRRRGFTAARRFRHLILDLYGQIQQDSQKLKEAYEKILTHLKLLNEDIDKFNLSYDFGLIAAQIEAMEGRSAPLGGGLMAPEREELSTRMRFKRRKFTEEELPPAPALPPLAEIKGKLGEILDRVYTP